MKTVNPKQLREVAAECRRNAPKLIEAVEVNMVKSHKDSYEETGIESFNVLHQKSKEAKVKVFDEIANGFVQVSNILEELADNAEQVSNSLS